MELVDLISQASKKAGSDAKLARELSIAQTILSDWKHDRRRCSPEDWALLAYIAGVNVEEALIQGVLEKHKDSKKGERLTTALGKGLHQLGKKATLSTYAKSVFLLMMSSSLMERATMYISLTKMRKIRSKRIA